MKIQKGDFGYIRSQKKSRLLLTAGLFSVPLVIFFIGLWQTGTRLNMFTFVAIMGCLPASRCAVGCVMMLLQKPASEEHYEKVEQNAGNLTRAYELTISAYEKNTPLDSVVICGYQIAGYTKEKKADIAFAENHIKEILKGNGYKAEVKIFQNETSYLERIHSLVEKKEEMEQKIPFTPDERYPELSRSELVKHTIMAISL